MSKRRKRSSNRKVDVNQQQLRGSIKADAPRPYLNDRVGITVVPEFSSADPRASVSRPPEGSPGIYKVTFVLATPGRATFVTDYDAAKWLRSGESLLMVPRGTKIRLDIENHPDVREMWFLSNTKGELASAEVTVEASTFLEAERKAYDALALQLSWWSYRYSVAMDISGYKVVEEQTDSVKFVFNVLGRVQALNLDDAQISTPKFRRVLSAYREAMGASNLFYRVICFFNVRKGFIRYATSVSKRTRLRDARCWIPANA